MFVGRERELQQLRRLLDIKIAHMVVIKGRRRIGKSTLINEFAKPFRSYVFMGLPPDEGTTAQMQRQEFIRRFKEQFDFPAFETNDWGDLFAMLAKQCMHGRVIIIFDEISWMAYDDPTFLGKLKSAWDLHFSQNKELILILCGSVSSWIDKMILNSTGYLGRPSLHMTIKELPLPDCNQFWGNTNKDISYYEKFKILSLTGGVPRYLELINKHLSAEENIRHLCFNASSPLYDEFKYIFSDIYGKRSAKYQEIITCLCKESISREGLIDKLDLPSNGDTTEDLDSLQAGGFISKDYTWNIKTKKISKFFHYRVIDNYTRFYLKYVLPNRAKIESGIFEFNSINELPGWDTILGLQFENLVLNNQKKIIDLIGLNSADVLVASPYFQHQTTRSKSCQIDYMIQTKHDVVYICEIKFRREAISKSIISEVKEKMLRVTLPRYVSRRAVLIHVNGVTDEVLDEDFFAKIIDFSKFLEK